MLQGTQLLIDADQTTLAEEVKTWPAEMQATFMQQLVQLDKVTPTGLVKYCQRGRQLLADSAANVNPYDKFKPEVPKGYFLKPGQEEFD